MLLGAFFDNRGRPTIEGRLSIFSLNVAADIPFLFDTGASTTVIMPADSIRLGINPKDPSYVPHAMHGIGSASGVTFKSLVAFEDDSGDLHAYRIPVTFVVPGTVRPDAPTLLGRDIINRWIVLLDATNRRFQATVLASDACFPKGARSP